MIRSQAISVTVKARLPAGLKESDVTQPYTPGSKQLLRPGGGFQSLFTKFSNADYDAGWQGPAAWPNPFIFDDFHTLFYSLVFGAL